MQASNNCKNRYTLQITPPNTEEPNYKVEVFCDPPIQFLCHELEVVPALLQNMKKEYAQQGKAFPKPVDRPDVEWKDTYMGEITL